VIRHAYTLIVVSLSALVVGIFAMTALGSSAPIKTIPRGPVTTTRTSAGQLTAVALPRPAGAYRGYVWRLARGYDAHVVREVSEADVQSGVVIVYRVVGRGRTSLIYGLTRGDSSPIAVKSVTHRIQAN
jgi:hypothetical protein